MKGTTMKTNTKKTIKTYCYGKLKEFPTLKAAKLFYVEAAFNSEGSERTRYEEILELLNSGETIVSDVDGIPGDLPEEKSLSEKEKKDIAAKIEECQHTKKLIVDHLDLNRKILAEKEAAFKKENAILIDSISALSDQANDLSLEIIRLAKNLRKGTEVAK